MFLKKLFILFIGTMIKRSSRSFFYSLDWLNHIIDMPEQQFQETFRMTRKCFEMLHLRLQSTTNMSNLKLKLYLFIFFIGHKSSYRKMREVFGMPKSTIHRYICEMTVILIEMAEDYINFPQPGEYNSLADGFEVVGGERGAILALDGTEIQCTKPPVNGFSYYNRKQRFSVTFICVVDYKLRFRGVAYGAGSSHDGWVYRISRLRRLVEGISDPDLFVVADSAFGGFEKVKVVHVTNANRMSPTQLHNLQKQRIKVENTFGLFKGKFKRFDTRTLNGHSDLSIKIVKCAMFLHNWIIDND